MDKKPTKHRGPWTRSIPDPGRTWKVHPWRRWNPPEKKP